MKTCHPLPLLCGTDFSAGAGAAAEVAAALAVRLKVRLLLAHACQVLAEGAALDSYDRAIALWRERLRGEAERLRGLGAEVEEILVFDPPDQALAQLAKQRGVGLLVVSSVGRRGRTRWLLGSVAERAAESAPVATLVVREAGPLVGWARGERVLRVFVGVDFSSSSDAALQWVGSLREMGACEVTVGYVDWPPEEAGRLGLEGPLGVAGSNPAHLQGLLERDLRAKVERWLGAAGVHLCVRGNLGRTDLPLVEMAAAAAADVAVVGTHQAQGLARLGHVSVSRGLLHRAPMSVACVPGGAVERLPGPRFRVCLRVLVAVDLAAPYGFAVPYAYSIVQPGGTVRLLHHRLPGLLLEGEEGAEGEESEGRGGKERSGVGAWEGRLRALIPEEAGERGLASEVEITVGWETAEAICAAAERFAADIVCIGAHTRPGFAARAQGSVALAVLRQSRRPVLVVWPPSE